MEIIGIAILLLALVQLWTHVRPKRAFAQGSLQIPTTQDGEGMGVTFTLFEDENSDVHFEKIKKAGQLLHFRIQQNNKLMTEIQENHKAHLEAKKAQAAKQADGNVTEISKKV